jgi:hypothetical protein
VAAHQLDLLTALSGTLVGCRDMLVAEREQGSLTVSAPGAEITDDVAVRSVLHPLAEQELDRRSRGCSRASDQQSRLGRTEARTPLQVDQ